MSDTPKQRNSTPPSHKRLRVVTRKDQIDSPPRKRKPDHNVPTDRPEDNKKRQRCLEKQRQALAKFGTVLSEFKEKPDFDPGEYYNDPLLAHPILSQFPIFDGADPKLNTLPYLNPDGIEHYLEYRLDRELRLKLENAKRKQSTFNPRPS